MDIAQAIEIIEAQRERLGLPFLETLEAMNDDVRELTREQRIALSTVMQAGQAMFSPEEM